MQALRKEASKENKRTNLGVSSRISFLSTINYIAFTVTTCYPWYCRTVSHDQLFILHSFQVLVYCTVAERNDSLKRERTWASNEFIQLSLILSLNMDKFQLAVGRLSFKRKSSARVVQVQVGVLCLIRLYLKLIFWFKDSKTKWLND